MPAVVVGYVPSDTGFLAVREGEREARSLRAELVIVNVVGEEVGYLAPTAADERNLDGVVAYLNERDVEHVVDQRSTDDSPADVILEVARQRDAKVIVIGLHRRSRVQKALLGSTAQQVVLAGVVPVLTVPNVDAQD
jgi:nucleotide-binding universal stress UspA family protein